MDFSHPEQKIEVIIKKFWSTMSALIVGDDHEDVHLRKLIERVKFNNVTKTKKIKKKIKVGMDTAIAGEFKPKPKVRLDYKDFGKMKFKFSRQCT
jgi:hypothetical protein